MAMRSITGKGVDMKRFLFAISVLCSFVAVAAFEDGEKVLVEGPVPPHTVGAYRPFLLPGVITEADGVTEYREGHGLKIWYPSSLSAAKTAELKRFMALPMKPIDTCHVAYIGDEKGLAFLKSLGIKPHVYNERNYWLVNSCEVIMLGGGIRNVLKQSKQIEALMKAVRVRRTIVMPGCDLDLFPEYSIAFSPAAADPSKAAMPELPVFLGVKRDFSEFLEKSKGKSYPALTGGPSWISPSSPAYFTHFKYKSISIIFMSVGPDDVPDAARDALTRLWCTVLANLNVYTK